MSETSSDTRLAVEAAKILLDGRDPTADRTKVLITLEHLVSLVLLIVTPNAKTAVRMLNEALVQGVENRIALHESKKVMQ